MKFWIAILLLAMTSVSANAEVYKWKDKDGTVRYSDVPPSGTTQYEPLKAKKPANGSIAAPVADANNASSAKSPIPIDASGNTAEQKEAQRKIKDKACANAKDNLKKLKQGGIVFRENSKGKREYLDETAMKTETAAAQKEVDISCK